MEIIGKRKIWFIISALIIIVGLGSLVMQGLNLGIDFTGGTLMEFTFDKEVTTGQIREVLAGFDLDKKSVVQNTGEMGILIRTVNLRQDEITEVQSAIKDKYSSAEMLRTEMVGPAIGSELKSKAYWALLIAAIAIVLYISYRFEFKFAIAALMALAHDVLIVIGSFSLVGEEVGSPFIAALLTVVGYSINDTIVIFDRIRETVKYRDKESFADLNNKAVLDTLPRSINTSMTTLVSILAILIFGGATIKPFMLALLIGILSGTYSSIFIASPVLVEIDAWKKRRNSKQTA
ncbi:protein translocase subunit SecF [Acetohalobium arabaticum]|uniref:Protein-export membrane protein SecF n=1 Tax=Acetohalobium arabaticum (strain ATCC 49924 / DSM 5501 / Z-7288) TaxID=574087 RepID=D9QVJ2_ACEAZ|nr:protein translocase subunit SecF [Acetohalobium arabaticum]ADL12251.1 protein translocase subunit secF [Acetohalobium arabaticum DSM 5501]